MMDWKRRCGSLAAAALPALGFTVILAGSALAQTPGAIQCNPLLGFNGASFQSASCAFSDPAGLSDQTEPGSVLIYPKFSGGSVTVDVGAAGQFLAPKTEIELGAVCPYGAPYFGTCAQNLPIKVKAHWVCEPVGATYQGAAINQTTLPCAETDFDLSLTVYGKLRFNPSAVPMDGVYPVGAAPNYPDTAHTVPSNPCGTNRGYLIVWTVDQFDRPVKFDGLIGDAVMRQINIGTAVAGQDLQSYSAIAIQADPNMPNFDEQIGGTAAAPLGNNRPVSPGANPNFSSGVANPPPSAAQAASSLINLRTGLNNPAGISPILSGLVFDGNPGSTPAAAVGHYQAVTGQFSVDVRFDQDDVPPFADTFLIVMTLDVISGFANGQTVFDSTFYNQVQTPLSVDEIGFICWRQVQLSQLDSNLTRSFSGYPKGMVVTSQATQGQGYATLIALTQTVEGPISGSGAFSRSYTNRAYNNSVPVTTTFWTSSP